MDSFNSHYTELKPSLVCSGVGVFAIKDIAAGTDIFYHTWRNKDVFFKWSLVTDTEVRKLIERFGDSK